jgi:hypothetical protein
MASGHNNNAEHAGATYHVQTEVRGAEHPFIDSTVFSRGKVLHRRTNSYHDLLPLATDGDKILQQRVDAQHLAVLEEIRSGALKLTAIAASPKTSQGETASSNDGLEIELLNPKNWLAAGQARLEVQVRARSTRASLPGARVEAHVEGAATPAQFVAQTGPDGQARLNFPMPRLGGSEAALVLFAAYGPQHTQVRFQLKAKPKAPAALGS